MTRGLAALAILSPAFLFAQNQSLAALALSEIPALDSSPTLAAWRNQHPADRLKNAAYDNEYESQGLWCAASVAAARQAFFYVPVSKPGDPLPARQDPALIQQCRLLALWYEVPDPGLFQSVSAELTASLGPAEEPSRFKRTDGDWGSGYWSPYLAWERPTQRIVLAVDPMGKRLLLIARASSAPRGLSFDWSGDFPRGQPSLKEAAARLASSDSALSAAMLAPKVSLQTLIQWLEAARGLPRERRAAALTLADLSVDTAQFGGPDFLATPAGKRLTELGADIRNGYDGLEYTHSWRSQAEQLDPAGPAGEIARLAHLESACSFEDGHNNWPDGLIQFGEKLLRNSPSNRWTSYVHLTLARTYAARLALTYPDVELNGANKPTNPAALRLNAIAHFRAFLDENRESPEAASARREAWRLLAGLPPSPVHFACSD